METEPEHEDFLPALQRHIAHTDVEDSHEEALPQQHAPRIGQYGEGTDHVSEDDPIVVTVALQIVVELIEWQLVDGIPEYRLVDVIGIIILMPFQQADDDGNQRVDDCNSRPAPPERQGEEMGKFSLEGH